MIDENATARDDAGPDKEMLEQRVRDLRKTLYAATARLEEVEEENAKLLMIANGYIQPHEINIRTEPSSTSESEKYQTYVELVFAPCDPGTLLRWLENAVEANEPPSAMMGSNQDE